MFNRLNKSLRFWFVHVSIYISPLTQTENKTALLKCFLLSSFQSESLCSLKHSNNKQRLIYRPVDLGVLVSGLSAIASGSSEMQSKVNRRLVSSVITLTYCRKLRFTLKFSPADPLSYLDSTLICQLTNSTSFLNLSRYLWEVKQPRVTCIRPYNLRLCKRTSVVNVICNTKQTLKKIEIIRFSKNYLASLTCNFATKANRLSKTKFILCLVCILSFVIGQAPLRSPTVFPIRLKWYQKAIYFHVS